MQRLNIKRSLYVMGIWLLPVILVIIEGVIFLSKANWGSDYVPYFITFWILRAVLSPLIVFYTLRFWVDHRKWLRFFLIHIGGFLLFSVLFWGLGFLILHNMLGRSELFGLARGSTNIGIFAMIVDNSVSINTIVYVSTVGICYIWEFFRQNTLINKKASDLERSLLVSKLELLKGQLNTHFLFNTLHTISSLVVRNQNEEANKMLIRLSELLRFALKENKEQLIPVRKEMEILQLYLDIQQLRFKDRLTVNVTVSPQAADLLIPSFLLQPIVENAVKYGVEPFSNPGSIEIVVKESAGMVVIHVKDQGHNEFRSIDFSKGIGLNNTKERLQQLYPGNHQFSIYPNPGGMGVVIHIEIPKIKENETIESSYS